MSTCKHLQNREVQRIQGTGEDWDAGAVKEGMAVKGVKGGKAGGQGSGEAAQTYGSHMKDFCPDLKRNGEPKSFLDGEIERITYEFGNNGFGCSKENILRVDRRLVSGIVV